MKYKKVSYSKLNGRQKEVFNFEVALKKQTRELRTTLLTFELVRTPIAEGLM